MTAITFQLGRLVLREDMIAPVGIDGSTNVRTVAVSGQESVPRHTADTVVQRAEDLLDIEGAFVPVVFSRKSYLNGFYVVDNPSGKITDDGSVRFFEWSATLRRQGPASEIDIESLLAGSQTRANNFVATGERTHAPAAGHNSYWASSSVPTTVDRPCADGGSIRLYRGIGSTVNPRWAVTPQNFALGRCRIIDSSSRERAGRTFTLDPTQAWLVHNGVLAVKPGSGGSTFDIGVWDGTQWEYVSWLVQADSPYATLASWDYITVLKNEYHVTILRFMKSAAVAGIGRFTLDLTLRRGARVLELYAQNEYSTQIKVRMSTGSAGTQTLGYITQNASDAAGNRYFVGSAKTLTPDTTNGGIEKTATLNLDAVVGSVLNGGSAISGDTAANLYAQYLGMPAEVVRGVRR